MDLTFNLRSMNKLERDIKVLMASLKMKNIEDRTQSVLNNQNKVMVFGVALSLTELLKCSQNLSKDAASDLDCMKNKHLKNQARSWKFRMSYQRRSVSSLKQ